MIYEDPQEFKAAMIAEYGQEWLNENLKRVRTEIRLCDLHKKDARKGKNQPKRMNPKKSGAAKKNYFDGVLGVALKVLFDEGKPMPSRSVSDNCTAYAHETVQIALRKLTTDGHASRRWINVAGVGAAYEYFLTDEQRKAAEQ